MTSPIAKCSRKNVASAIKYLNSTSVFQRREGPSNRGPLFAGPLDVATSMKRHDAVTLHRLKRRQKKTQSWQRFPKLDES